jgi:hypothetical protein
VGRLARTGGTLVGAALDGSVQTWLAGTDGQLTAVRWPGNFRARFDPLEILDHHGHVIARGGHSVTLTGGYLPLEVAQALGYQRVFSAWQASERDL